MKHHHLKNNFNYFDSSIEKPLGSLFDYECVKAFLQALCLKIGLKIGVNKESADLFK